MCDKLSSNPPDSFHEAIQMMFLIIISSWFGENHGLTAPGRMDQTLLSYYQRDIKAGRITREEAFLLICSLYIQLNRLLWPGSAISVLVGGVDGTGNDVTNELTYLCLAARLATKLVYPTVAVAWNRRMPEELMDFCIDLLATGIGDPAFFNHEVISAGLRERGVTARDAVDYMNSTCVEIKVVGASNIWVTQPYFNLPQGLLDVLAAVAGGEIDEPESFDEFSQAVRDNIRASMRKAAQRLDRVWSERARTGCFPLASCMTADCLEKGRDFDRGGARYNWVENSFVGLANLTDSLISIKQLVYEDGEVTLGELNQILANNFAGHEPFRRRILIALPKYGNDDEEADSLAAEWAEWLISTTESFTVGLSEYSAGFFCWIKHEQLGSQTGATPDGRKSGLALADGAGAAQGRELAGPTASILSTTKWSHQKVLGGLVHNAKFSGIKLENDSERSGLRDIIETFLQRGGFEIQVNIVRRETLIDAREHPERYPDLLVRVAGYSDYFTHLNANMQQEIILRTEHTL